MSTGTAAGEAGSKAAQPPVIRAGESLSGSPIRFIGKETFIKLAAGDSACPITVLEDVSPPQHGPPLHSHEFEEFFYILTGEVLFEMNGAQFNGHPGDFVHVAAGIPHTFQNVSDQNARMLILTRPGGIERYFTELEACSMANPGNIAALNGIGVKYGIKVLGPPIAARNQPR
jgi:mannose-6-phosphate isomerase-like protein (cupin superfamily)